jgi:regulator of protease activity HflC (stomatin/prohibitin superfamily)
MFDYSIESFLGPIILVVIFFISIIIIVSAIKIVTEDKRMNVYRLGRFIGEKGPGIVLLIPILDKGIIVDPADRMKKVQRIRNGLDAIGETITPV